jgi:uncharacterized RDD family membrane protein YckC
VTGERWRDLWPVLVQGAGIAAMAVGFGLLAVWAGVVIGGAGLTILGLALELGRGKR